MNNLVKNNNIVILGAGLTGLSAGYILSRHDRPFTILEKDGTIGGLARTVNYHGFRFDLGGHRFISNNKRLNTFVQNLLQGRWLSVPRSSKIYFDGQLLSYPIEPLDILQHFSARQTVGIFTDYCLQQFRTRRHETRSLESWVIDRFGQRLYELFFKQYSEKVWGIPCNKIDSGWIAQRIQNLDLLQTLKQSLLTHKDSQYTTLAERFLYPCDGINAVAKNLSRCCDDYIHLESFVSAIHHDDRTITGVDYINNSQARHLSAPQVISTLPLPVFIRLLRPKPPAPILTAAQNLRSRDLVLVVTLLNTARATRENWIYFPQREFPFGRLHEPKNWSTHMAPRDKTALVTEHFCFRGDPTWSATDGELITNTVAGLERAGIAQREQVFDAVVIRIKNAYPLFELGYRDHRKRILDYLARFENLRTTGRAGAFVYNNMDHCLLDGMYAAAELGGASLTFKHADLLTDFMYEDCSDEMCLDHSGLAT